MTIRVYVAEIGAYDDSVPGTTTLYFGTHGFSTLPGDTPAHTYVAPRIKQPASIRREIASGDDLVGGRTRVTLGDLVLLNEDGALDYMADLAFDGRPVTLRIGPQGGAYPSDFTIVFVGTMDGAEFRRRDILVRLRDRALELDVPLQTERFAGTATGSGDIEGTADDLKGKVKPWGRGVLFEVPPAYVNTGKLMFQAHDGEADSIDAVYLGGNGATEGSAQASQAALEGATVTAGTYDYWLGGSVFRLETEPQKQVTCDITIGDTAADRTAARIAEYLVGTVGPIASGDITAADITALDTANSAEIGYWTADEGRTIAEALDEVCRAVGAYWWFDRLGAFRVVRLEDPSSGTAGITLRLPGLGVSMGASDAKIVDYEFLDPGLPVWRLTLGYRRIELVQTGGLAGAALDDEGRAAYLAEQYRATDPASDSAVQTKHPQARDIRIDTRIVTAAAAATERDRRLTLLKADRQKVRVTVAIEDSQVAATDLGKIVEVKMDRYGLGSGKKLLVIGQELDLRRSRADLILWG